MKFLSFTLVALLGLVACQPITKTHPKKVESEADEEKASASEKAEFSGMVLSLTPEATQIVRGKQGKARRRALGLRPDEQAENRRQLENLNILSVRLRQAGQFFYLTGSYKSQKTQIDQDIFVQLTVDANNPSRWTGKVKSQNFVVTCLPLGEKVCNPKSGSVIEVMSLVALSNHKPRTFAFLYGETDILSRSEGDLPSNFERFAVGTLRSIAVLNADAPVPTALSLQLFSKNLISFSAQYDPDASGGMLWKIDRDGDTGDFELGEGSLTQSTSINLPLKSRDGSGKAWIMKAHPTRALQGVGNWQL